MSIEEEKEKLRYAHLLELRKSFFDKILLGIILGLFGIIANLYIDVHKSELVSERFKLEVRYEKFEQLGIAFFYLSDELFNFTYKPSKEHADQINDMINKYNTMANYNSLLLPAGFEKNTYCLNKAFKGLLRVVLDSPSGEFSDFVLSVSKSYRNYLKILAGNDRLDNIPSYLLIDCVKGDRSNFKILQLYLKNWNNKSFSTK